MARIQFDYAWDDEAKTVMRFTALAGWTWKDYHAVAHIAQFAMNGVDGPVHILIDFSQTPQDRFPGGAAAHVRTFGRRDSPKISGNVVVIGMPQAILAKLGVGDRQIMTTKHGEIHFVETSTATQQRLAAWAAG